MNHRYTSLILAIFLSLTGCFGSSSDTETGGGGNSTGSSCGAVVNGSYQNDPETLPANSVSFVGAPSNNTLIVRDTSGNDLLVRLHGLSGEPSSKRQAAIAFITVFAGSGGYFLSSGCEEQVAGGGRAALGSFFNYQGQSLAEGLARAGLVLPNPGDACEGGNIGSCLEGISDSDPLTAGELSRFLWKPVSDSNGRLAVHTGPFGATVIVNGEVGVNQGAGNGYGSLARFSRPGCAYGAPQIQVLDQFGLSYTVNGQTTFSVPSGCGRYCVEDGNGSVFACSKN